MSELRPSKQVRDVPVRASPTEGCAVCDGVVGPRRVHQGGGPTGNHGCARGCAQAPLRRSAVRRAAGGALPVYRRSTGTASCRVGELVAEIGVIGAVNHIGGSNRIPGLVPRSWGSPSYEMGKVEHGSLRG